LANSNEKERIIGFYGIKIRLKKEFTLSKKCYFLTFTLNLPLVREKTSVARILNIQKFWFQFCGENVLYDLLNKYA